MLELYYIYDPKPEIEQQLVGDLVDLRVEYNGEIGVIKKDEGGNYRDWETDRKSTRLNSSHSAKSRMPSSA